MASEGPSSAIPLASAKERRFDVSALAALSNRAGRRSMWVGLIAAIGAAVFLVIFSLMFVLARYFSLANFVGYCCAFGFLFALGMGVFQFARVPRSPIAIDVGPDGVGFEYPGAASRAISWDETGDLVWLLDQRKRTAAGVVVGSDFGCRIRGGRTVVGGGGVFSPITSEAFESILAQAKEAGVVIDTLPFYLPRGGVLKGVTVLRLSRSGD